MTWRISPRRKVKPSQDLHSDTALRLQTPRRKGMKHQSLRAVVFAAGRTSCCSWGWEPRGPLMVCAPSLWLGLHSLVVRRTAGCKGEVADGPPSPLGSTRHSGSNCMSLGSSAGCTGSGLLRCCCGHTDSPRAGGRGRHCEASPGDSEGALYCSGPPL